MPDHCRWHRSRALSDGENAVLLPSNDPEDFAERTAALARDESQRKRLGSNARLTILQKMASMILYRG